MYLGVVLIAVIGRWRESVVSWTKHKKKEMLFWEVSKWMLLSRGRERTIAVVQLQNDHVHLERQ